MHLDEELDYPAGPDRVAALLADPSFVEEVCTTSGATDAEVAVTGGPAEGFRVATRRAFPTATLPDFARHLVGDTITVGQTDTWEAPGADGVRHGVTAVELGRLPVRISATATLAADAADPGRTVQSVAVDIVASVPFIGAKVERAAAPVVTDALRHQARVAAERLA